MIHKEPVNSFSQNFLEIFLGSLAGLIFSIIGMGPGLIIVSTLHTVCKHPLKKAITGSLMLLVPISTFAAFLHHGKTSSLPPFLGWLLFGNFIGVILGILARKFASGKQLKIFFCLFLLLILLRHWLQIFGIVETPGEIVELAPHNHALIGITASFISSVMGIGGGVLIVTFYFAFLNFPAKLSIQISVYFVILNAWLNSLICFRQLYWNRSLTNLILGGIAGCLLGLLVFDLISEQILRILYGLFLVAVLIKMLPRNNSTSSTD